MPPAPPASRVRWLKGKSNGKEKRVFNQTPTTFHVRRSSADCETDGGQYAIIQTPACLGGFAQRQKQAQGVMMMPESFVTSGEMKMRFRDTHEQQQRATEAQQQAAIRIASIRSQVRRMLASLRREPQQREPQK
jgi:hypothetical protein